MNVQIFTILAPSIWECVFIKMCSVTFEIYYLVNPISFQYYYTSSVIVRLTCIRAFNKICSRCHVPVIVDGCGNQGSHFKS